MAGALRMTEEQFEGGEAAWVRAGATLALLELEDATAAPRKLWSRYARHVQLGPVNGGRGEWRCRDVSEDEVARSA